MTKRINVQGYGLIDFPDDMSDEQIANAIENELIKQPSAQKPEEKEPSGFFRRAIADPLVSLSQGVIGLKDAGVGLLNIPTMGYAGKAVEAVEEAVLPPKIANLSQTLQELKSPELQAAEQKVSEAEGFTDTAKAYLKNPSSILSGVVETVPLIYGGGIVGRGLANFSKAKNLMSKGVVPDYGKAAAVGEGLVGSGLFAETVRKESESGTLSPTQSGLAILTGSLTGVLGRVGNRAAKKLGVDDIDAIFAGEVPDEAKHSLLTNIIGSALVEGTIEELPQSIQEQVFQNIALDKPPFEGVPEAAASAVILGGAMGGAGGAGVYAQRKAIERYQQDEQKAAEELLKEQQNKLEETPTEEDLLEDPLLAYKEVAEDVIDTEQQQPIPEAQYTPTGDSITLLGQPIRISAEGIGGAGPYGAGVAGAPIDVGQPKTREVGEPTPLAPKQPVETKKQVDNKIEKIANDELDAEDLNLGYLQDVDRRRNVHNTLIQTNPEFQNAHPYIITGGFNSINSPLEKYSIGRLGTVTDRIKVGTNAQGKSIFRDVKRKKLTKSSLSPVKTLEEATVKAIDDAAFEDALDYTERFDKTNYDAEITKAKKEAEQVLETEYQNLLAQGLDDREIKRQNPIYNKRDQRTNEETQKTTISYFSNEEFEKELGDTATQLKQQFENTIERKVTPAEQENMSLREDFKTKLNEEQQKLYDQQRNNYIDVLNSTKKKIPPTTPEEQKRQLVSDIATYRYNLETDPKDKTLIKNLKDAETRLNRVIKSINKQKAKQAKKTEEVRQREQAAQDREDAKELILAVRDDVDESAVELAVADQEINDLIANTLADGPVTLDVLLNRIASRLGDPANENIQRTYAFERMAHHLSKLIKSTNNPVQVQLGTIASGNPGQFDPTTNTVTIDLNNTQAVNAGQVVVHETMHAALDHIIDNPKNLTADQKAGIQQLRELKKYVDMQLPEFKTDNLNEFVAEVYSNQAMQRAMSDLRGAISRKVILTNKQEFLAIQGRRLSKSEQTELEFLRNVKTDESIVDRLKNVIKKFSEAVSRILGFRSDKYGFNKSLLGEVSMEIEGLLRGKGYVPPIDIRGKKLRYAKKAEDKVVDYDEEFEKDVDKVGSKEYIRQGVGTKIKQAYNDKAGAAENIVIKFQNRQRPLLQHDERARASNQLIVDGPEQNNIGELASTMLGEGLLRYKEYIELPMKNLEIALYNLTKEAGIEMTKALDTVFRYGQALDEKDRRRVLYRKRVPLDDKKKIYDVAGEKVTAARFREIIEDRLADDPTLGLVQQQGESDVAFRKRIERRAKQYATLLDNVIKKGKSSTGFTSEEGYRSPEALDENSNLYDSSDYDAQKAEFYRQKLEREPENIQQAIKTSLAMVKQLQNIAKELNAEGNYMPQQARNVIAFYGMNNYMPLKGKASRGYEKKNDVVDIFGERLGSDPNALERPMEGRKSIANNGVIQTMIDAVTASSRAGRKNYTKALINSIKQGLIKGEVSQKYSYKDRLKGLIPENDKGKVIGVKGRNKLVHYNEDGSVEIIRIDDEKVLNAIRGVFEEANPMTNLINSITSRIGQFHTRFNPAFPILNFVRDTLTNAYVLAAEKPSTMFSYTNNIAAQFYQGAFFKTNKIVRMYNRGDIQGMRDYAKRQGKGSYASDMVDFMLSGGAVSYIESLSTASKLEELYKSARKPGKTLYTKNQISLFFDGWMNTFELAARMAAYRATKPDFAKKLRDSGRYTEEQIENGATKQAAAYAKNLANFEQVGEWGRFMGGMFMFFRPSATGAVRALDAISPLLQSKETYQNRLPKVTQDNPEALEAAMEDFKKRRTAAAIVTLAVTGLGVTATTMAYMMSGADDEDRNKVATDDPDRWTRFARFDIGGEEMLSIPWGFGLGGFAALGSQMALKAINDKMTTKQMFGNMLDITLDSFLPLPVSRMNPSENVGMYVLDSVTPSALRPMIEYYMNVNSFGYAIYNNRQSRNGFAYTGGDNIPQAYKDAAQLMNEITDYNVDVSPNVLYFFANNYFDGWSRMLHSLRETDLLMSGESKADLDTISKATMVLDSFISKRSLVDQREYSKAEKEIKNIERRLTQSMKRSPEEGFEFIDRNPEAPILVESYKEIKKQLDKLAKRKNDIREMKDLTPKMKSEELEDLKYFENALRRQLLFLYEDSEID